MADKPFDPQPTLDGNMVHLRPLRRDDYEALCHAASDPLIWEQHPENRHEPSVFHAFFDEALASGGALLITHKPSGEVIGTSRFHGYDPVARELEIGWTFLVRKHWGGAINADLKRTMMKHAFQWVDSVLYLIHPTNIRSQRGVEKLGARRDETVNRDDAWAFRIPRPAT